jgi:hypothetical protein
MQSEVTIVLLASLLFLLLASDYARRLVRNMSEDASIVVRTVLFAFVLYGSLLFV